MGELFIPTLHTFAMQNTFTGSCGLFRFKVTPSVTMCGKEVDFENSNMRAEYWHGMFCYEKSEIEATEVFPLSEEGRISMQKWLESNI